jgi:hypothetical protein
MAAAALPAQAQLIYENIDGVGFVFDTVTDATWTQNANLSNQTYSFQDAATWAANLSFPGINSSWLLPDAQQLTSLYTQLDPYGAPGVQDNKYGATVAFGGGINDVVNNVQTTYWTNNSQTDFNFFYGYAGTAANSNLLAAWAVTTVPAPSALWLFGAAIAGMMGLAPRKRNNG